MNNEWQYLMYLNWQHLMYFLVAADTGNFTTAAEQGLPEADKSLERLPKVDEDGIDTDLST